MSKEDMEVVMRERTGHTTSILPNSPLGIEYLPYSFWGKVKRIRKK
jgi:hypothetical protein